MTPKTKRHRILPALLLAVAAIGLLSYAALRALGAGEALAPVEFDSDTWAAECTAYTAENRSRNLSDGAAALTCGSFAGAEDLWNIPETAEEVTIDCAMTVGQGKADLALVSPDGTVVRLSEQELPYTFTPGAGGMTRLRLIGDGGKDIEATITIWGGDGCWVVG